MKRRFPGGQNGPRGQSPVLSGAPQRPHDPRFPGRGGNGPAPQMQRGPPPAGRFGGRVGPRAPGGFMPGRGPPGPGIGGNLPQNIGVRGPPPGMHGRGPPPIRDMMGRGMPPPPMGGRGNMGRGRAGGRGLMAGRPPPPMERGHPGVGPPGPPGMPPNIPPPPPRGSGALAPPGRGPPPQPLHLPHPHGVPPGVPPPPIRPGFPNHQPQASLTPNMNTIPTAAFPSQPQPGVAVAPRAGVAPQTHFQQSMQPNHTQTVHAARAPQITAPYQSVAAGSVAGAVGNQTNQVTAGGHQQIAASLAPASSSSYSKEQIEMAWKEYDGPNGVKYYHNSVTKESTYTKPESLVKKDNATKSAATVSQWKEYEDANTGKKYYSNGVTTTWEKPAGFQSGSEVSATEEAEQPAKKKKKTAPKKESEFANKAEATAAFKGLLLAKGIAPTLKWNEVVKLCSSDSRWAACEDALSVGERRQALAEYQTKRANELRDQERQERIRAKEAFGQLLTEVLPSVSGFSAWSSRFPDVRSSLSKDDRFYAVEDEETRESLFLDFCEEFRKRDERKKRSRKREAQDAFLAFLGEKEEAGSLTFASTWDSFLSSMDDNDMNDPRFKTSAAISDSDRQLYFADFVIELQAAEDEKRRRIRDARRRAEKAQREGYRELLRKMASESQINPYTRWRSIQDIVSEDESFKLVQAQDRDSPRELFEEFIEEWNEGYRRERSFLGRLMSAGRKEVRVKGGTTYEQFTKMLLDEAAYSPDVYGDVRRIINREQPISSARLYYKELTNRRSESRQAKDDSSEDEGEIIEEGEVSESAVVEVRRTAPTNGGAPSIEGSASKADTGKSGENIGNDTPPEAPCNEKSDSMSAEVPAGPKDAVTEQGAEAGPKGDNKSDSASASKKEETT